MSFFNFNTFQWYYSNLRDKKWNFILQNIMSSMFDYKPQLDAQTTIKSHHNQVPDYPKPWNHPHISHNDPTTHGKWLSMSLHLHKEPAPVSLQTNYPAMSAHPTLRLGTDTPSTRHSQVHRAHKLRAAAIPGPGSTVNLINCILTIPSFQGPRRAAAMRTRSAVRIRRRSIASADCTSEKPLWKSNWKQSRWEY